MVPVLLFAATLPLTAKTFIHPDHPYIRYIGRVDTSRKNRVLFDWPGIMLEASFEGTSCAIGLKGGIESYNVFINGEFSHRIKTDTLKERYEIASGLPDTIHHLLVTKRYEMEGRISACTGLFLDDNKKLHLLPPRPHYRIEFIGSSTLIGFGNESKSIKCAHISDSSNSFYSFGPVAARMLGAEYSLIAATGRGMVRNWGSPFLTSKRPFPAYYRRTLWQSSSSPEWNHRTWVPQVIVISLGTNDFTTPPQPTRALFINRYRAFIQEVYSRNPGVYILCLTSDREPYRSYVHHLVEQEKQEGNRRIGFFAYEKIPVYERGCNWHPNIKAHYRIAAKLAVLIKPILEKCE